jgi:4-amino-4-deoxy-L-arabinose transferase-like glycosyltransferase
MYRVSESLLWHHSLRITDPLLHINEPYATYGLAVPLTILPLVAAGHAVLGDGSGFLTLYQPAVTAATVLLVALIARELGCAWRAAIGLAVLYGFATLAWFYSNILFSEPLVGLATALAFLGLLRFKRERRVRWLAVTGGAVALACLTRTDAAVVTLLPMSFYVAAKLILGNATWTDRIRRACAYGVPVVVAGVIVLWYDWLRYGSPSATGYLSSQTGFTFPILEGLYGLLLSPAAGLFIFMPVLLLAVVGFPSFLRRHRGEALLLAGLVTVRLVFYSSWYGWDGGENWGPRFLVPVLPLLVLPLAFLPGWIRPRLSLSILGGLSVMIQVLGQLVSYHSYSIWTVRTMPVGISLPACTTCGIGSAVAMQAAKNILDFDWSNAPMLVQLLILLQFGPVRKSWSLPLAAVAFVLLVGGGALLGWRQLKAVEAVAASTSVREATATAA